MVPSETLSVSLVVLAIMPITYLLSPDLSAITYLLFSLFQVVLMSQGATIVLHCRWQKRIGELRRYGICLALYGAVAFAIAFWFLLLAVLGGPARDQVPVFLAKLWIIFAALYIPPGLYLRRRGVSLFRKPHSNK